MLIDVPTYSAPPNLCDYFLACVDAACIACEKKDDIGLLRREGNGAAFHLHFATMGVCDNWVVRDALLKRASTRKSSSFWLKGFVR